jgi:glutathione S-transferase
MIQVWGRRNSGNVIKVLWCLRELGRPFGVEEVGGPHGKNKEDWFLALNPNGLVPVLRDEDGYVVWESNVIVRYLAAKYSPGGMWPNDVRGRCRSLDGLAHACPTLHDNPERRVGSDAIRATRHEEDRRRASRRS